MTTDSQKFFDDVKKERREKLLGIVMDIGYFTQLETYFDETKLRNDLAEERSKYELNKKGKPTKFTGDAQRVKDLELAINRLEDIKKKKTSYEALYHDMVKYIDFIQSPDAETVKRVDEIFDKFKV